MFKALGRDPNAKDFEVKKLVNEYDKVARRLIAKIKKGRYDAMFSRHTILKKPTRDNRAAQIIYEEITTLVKGMHHDLKRLKGILNSISEKKDKED